MSFKFLASGGMTPESEFSSNIRDSKVGKDRRLKNVYKISAFPNKNSDLRVRKLGGVHAKTKNHHE
jgi:hypothetical protein